MALSFFQNSKICFLGSDHAGLEYRIALAKHAVSLGLEVVDLGISQEVFNVEKRSNYCDYAVLMAEKIVDPQDFGVLICGSGIGMSIAVNRFSHIRGALCHNRDSARLSREHNNANVLILGARLIDLSVALDCFNTFGQTSFEGGYHQERVDSLKRIGQNLKDHF